MADNPAALPTMADYLVARVTQMAAIDGAAFSTLYLVGAVNALQTELFAARDALLINPPRAMEVAGAAHGATEQVADAVPEQEPASPDETTPEPEALSTDQAQINPEPDPAPDPASAPQEPQP